MANFAPVLKAREPVLLDRDDGHWYQTKFDKIYPSISTILSATAPEHKKNGLQIWKENEPAHEYITKQAQDIGTQSHKIIEDYLTHSLALEEFDLLPIAHFNNLKPFLDNISDVTCIEQRMYSDRLQVAGTSDLIAEYNGELSIIDYKTKRKPQIDDYMYEYYLQTTCYAQMFEEATGQKINQVVILVSSEKNTRQEFIKTCDDYVGPMAERVEKYYLNRLQ
ncbi:MAG: PD-(D/E)XK nuclease family protein [Nitrosopumilus sp.]|nr:PD-(D/E)XK nuclease family protein [Nitrosopumilus sp.]MDF2423186.1 PD-(D/E)XK nuclease family protein [Nitrosopumilus sp.]MDF2426027.1 PD-(D/E)XK nuclease family protein [Nitrosopumilus sp.]MDF2427503.1 PD-(D/E)XK nuclease family protein [Nitrosopumilus sp.]MDF2427625.1 PD-(D/E)XK nuclease family protein [Nitrosopumilus sp.]